MLKVLQNLFKKEEEFVEGSAEPQELLRLEMKDDDLVRQIDKDIENSQSLYQMMKQVQDENEAYYLGSQLDKSVFTYELPTAENLLYMATETIVSIITSQRKEPLVLASQNTDESKDLSEKTKSFLSWKWSDEKMKTKYEDWVRHSMLSRIGVFKIRWDLERDDFVIEVLRPQRIMVDKDATDELNAKFIVQFREDSLADLIEMFPEAKDKLRKEYGDKLGTKIKYLEYWTNEFVVFKVNSIVLKKMKNPNWNWDEKDRKDNLKKLKKRWIEKTKDEKLKNILLNYFNEPRKPFVILSIKNLGKDIYADTSDFEQGKVIQDIVNRRKRSIDKAAQKAIGREVFSGSYISKAEAKKTINNPNAPIWLDKGRAGDAVTHIAPAPVSPVLFSDLQDSKQALDNVMGTHGTTRGEQGPQETARGRTILKEGDFGRIDLAVRRIDEKLELLYAWMLQMVKVYYTEEHFYKLLGQEDAISYLKFSTDDIEDGQEVVVKSELTVNKSEQRENIVRKAEGGLLDPLSYYEAFDESNAKESARRLVIFQQDPMLYANEFCVSSDTPGMENDSKFRAETEQKKIMEGEEVRPWKNADKLHIETHNKFIQSSEFKGEEDVEIKNNMLTHIQGEIELLRGVSEMKQGGQGGQPPQGGMPQGQPPQPMPQQPV